MTVFRIVKASRARDAFTGEGARLAGGRWNFPGQDAIYCSSTLALAALETFIHIGTDARLKFVSFDVDIPDSVPIESLDHPPKGWQAEPPGAASMRVGSTWLSQRRSVALQVPSVLIPREKNVVLNPEHPDFSTLKISRPQRFHFDSRMWK